MPSFLETLANGGIVPEVHTQQKKGNKQLKKKVNKQKKRAKKQRRQNRKR